VTEFVALVDVDIVIEISGRPALQCDVHRSRAARSPARPSQLSFRWNFHGDRFTLRASAARRPSAMRSSETATATGGQWDRPSWRRLLADLWAVERGLVARLLIDAAVERRSKRPAGALPGPGWARRAAGTRPRQGWTTTGRSIDVQSAT